MNVSFTLASSIIAAPKSHVSRYILKLCFGVLTRARAAEDAKICAGSSVRVVKVLVGLARKRFMPCAGYTLVYKIYTYTDKQKKTILRLVAWARAYRGISPQVQHLTSFIFTCLVC